MLDPVDRVGWWRNAGRSKRELFLKAGSIFAGVVLDDLISVCEPQLGDYMIEQSDKLEGGLAVEVGK